jgi:hypothetical protein
MGFLNHFEKPFDARLAPDPAVNAGEGSGVPVGVILSLSFFWKDFVDFRVPLSRSSEYPRGAEARDREREEEEPPESFEATLPSEEASLGKTRSAMTFTEGAQATTMARWFSRTDQIMALPNQSNENVRITALAYAGLVDRIG